MIVEGVSLQDIDNLSVDDCRNLWMTLQSGLWGPHKDFHIAYVSIIPHISSKKGTPSLEKVFPEFYDWAMLGQKGKSEELATKAAKVMLAMGGAPKHIRDKLLGTQDA